MTETKSNSRLKEFIKDHSYYWWWVPEEAKEHLGLNSIVEATLNYGSLEDIKTLFQLIGLKKVAMVFFEQIQKPRTNYSPRTINFFKLYFNRHVSSSS